MKLCWNERLHGVENKSLCRWRTREPGKQAKNAVLELNYLTGNYSPRGSSLLGTLGQFGKKLAVKKKTKKHLQVEHFLFLKFFSHETREKGGVILLET